MSDVYPELIIGIVGRMGVDTVTAAKWIDATLHSLHYRSHVIKLTDYLAEVDVGVTLVDEPIEQRYETRIDACNKVRELANRKDFFASVAISGITSTRENVTPSTDGPTRQAYIIDQIKRPEEAKALREVYGEQFILVSCHTPMEERISSLAGKIAGGHAGKPKPDTWASAAKHLIDIDNSEASKDFGQRVGKVFHLADMIIDCSSETGSKHTLKRFFEALFGNPTVSPTRPEFFQNIAMNVALTSCDTARQVGAAIERQGDIAATGYNEAPKAGGGTYWSNDGFDARDVALGMDLNTIRKRQMVTEVVQILRERNELSDNEITDAEISKKYLDDENAPLQDSQIMDTLEFGRAVHAEMAALSTAARLGISTLGSTLYCTTFPCHNCSKHIVASGVSKVVYLEPYPKSFADYLYPDSILIDPVTKKNGLVVFEQFVGITPVRYRSLFQKSSSKDGRGYVAQWEPRKSFPVLTSKYQEHFEREIIFQKKMLDSVTKFSPQNATTLGLRKEAPDPTE
ncbi:anti-phage dCTP deaminase [Sulfitobacter sp. R86518]|uniref:anti-phage dCTP deaminase n=1 Tax=Sulfitobacter sp. R86518 TaxID=3093858 RepID=UPI0036DC288D